MRCLYPCKNGEHPACCWGDGAVAAKKESEGTKLKLVRAHGGASAGAMAQVVKGDVDAAEGSVMVSIEVGGSASTLAVPLDDLEFGGSVLLLKVIAVYSWSVHLLSVPYLWIFKNTIPSAKHYWLSFMVNIVWIMALCYVMLVLVTRLCIMIGVGRFTASASIIAAGTSVPDALGSILVAQDGFANMAVSNAIGSNVFDILLGLGFPYLISIAMDGRLHMAEWVQAECHWHEQGPLMIKAGGILLGILVYTMVGFVLTKFKLSKPLGYSFLALYLAWIIYLFCAEKYCNGGYDC